MKTKKTPQSKRATYKLFDELGDFVIEYKAGKDGVSAEDIQELHKMDDHEVYVNRKESRHPAWFQPIYNEWKDKYISDFKKHYGYLPEEREIPGHFRLCESIDAQNTDEDEIGDSSKLELELAVYDRDDAEDAISYMRKLVSDMPEKWQRVYQLVFVEEMQKQEAASVIGISNARVGQLVKKITAILSENEQLKKFFRKGVKKQ